MNLTGAQAVLAILALVAGPGGAAWVAVRVSLNGARQDIRDIKAGMSEMTKKQSTTDVEVARLDVRVKTLEEAA